MIPVTHIGSQIGISHSGPSQPGAHSQLSGATQLPFTQVGSQIALWQWDPCQPGSQTHVSGAAHTPLSHGGVQIGMEQSIPCQPGWQGLLCDKPICDPDCVNGTCVLPEVCECDLGWEVQVSGAGLCQRSMLGARHMCLPARLGRASVRECGL